MSLYRAAANDHDRRALVTPGRIVTLYTLAVALVPPVYAYASDGLRAVFGSLTADAFVYLSVAANSHPGFYTFDGVNPTNGFHPLWQVQLQALFQALHLAGDKPDQLLLVYGLSVALVAAGGVFVALAVLRVSGSIFAAMLTFPGLFGMWMLFCGWPAGTMWSFMNGMESPLSLFFFGLTLLYLFRTNAAPFLTPAGVNRNALLVMSLLSIGIVFSRLDDLFLAASFAGWLLLQREAPPAVRLRAALWFGLPLGGALLAYLAYNALAIGHALPISATAKFDFRTPLLNVGFLGSSLHALIPDFLYNPFGAGNGDFRIAEVNWRNAQMLGPMIVARLMLGHSVWRRPGGGALPAVMRPLLIYVLVKGGYNFLFVPLIHQGHWYYPLSITIVNIAAALIVTRLCAAWAGRGPAIVRLAAPLAAAATALSLILYTQSRLGAGDNARLYALFTNGPRIAAALRARVPSPRVVEADDGIINYALGLPTLSGFLFSIDPAGYKAYAEGAFLTEATRRGYQLIGSVSYLRNATPAELTPDRIPGTLRERLFNGTDWNLDKFDFSLAYRDEATGAVFIRFTPKR